MNLESILRSELNRFATKVEGGLDILETGCIRFADEKYHTGDGWSTLLFAQYVRDHEGSFHSVDLSTRTAKEVLEKYDVGEYARFHEGYSIDVLSGMVANAYAVAEKTNSGQVLLGGDGFVDVLFLDSDNDGELILHEFMVGSRMLRSPGLVIVDDVDLESATVRKGNCIVPWLKERGTKYTIRKRHGDGFSTGVLVFEV